MPVQKFRSVEAWQAAKQEQWLSCDDSGLVERLRAHWRRWSRLAPLGVAHGVRKYRSAEEAEAERDEWETERILRLRAERLRK